VRGPRTGPVSGADAACTAHTAGTGGRKGARNEWHSVRSGRTPVWPLIAVYKSAESTVQSANPSAIRARNPFLGHEGHDRSVAGEAVLPSPPPAGRYSPNQTSPTRPRGPGPLPASGPGQQFTRGRIEVRAAASPISDNNNL